MNYYNNRLKNHSARTYARLIIPMEINGERKYKVITGTSVVAGEFTYNELMARKEKLHLENRTRDKNFRLKEDGTLVIKPMPLGEADIYLSERIRETRFISKNDYNDTDNIFGIYEGFVSNWEYDIFYDAVKSIYNLPKKIYDEVIRNYEERYKRAMKQLMKND